MERREQQEHAQQDGSGTCRQAGEGAIEDTDAGGVSAALTLLVGGANAMQIIRSGVDEG